MNQSNRGRFILRRWVPITVAVAVLLNVIAVAFVVVVGRPWRFSCPSSAWQQSAVAEMEAITPTSQHEYIYQSDCDDQAVVSYDSDHGDAAAKAAAIERAAGSRGWQLIVVEGAPQCRAKDLGDGMAYLTVVTAFDADAPIASALISPSDSDCVARDPAESACPSDAWEQSALSELKAITLATQGKPITRSDCEHQRLVDFESQQGDGSAIADSIVSAAKSRGWQQVKERGAVRCLSKALTDGMGYLAVVDPSHDGLPSTLAFISPTVRDCERF